MTIGTKQHEILDLSVAALLDAVNDVVKPCLTFGRNFQTNGEWLAGSSASIGFLFRQIAVRVAALVCVGARAFGDVVFYRLIVTLFFRSEIAIRLAFFEQTVRSGAVRGRVFRLKDEVFVVVESEPLESFDDRAG